MKQKNTSTRHSNLLSIRENEINNLPAWSRIIRGTLMCYYRTCGNRGCHCYKGKQYRHGPYWYLSVSWQKGKQKLYAIDKSILGQVKEGISFYNMLWERIYKICELNLALLKERRQKGK